MDEKIFRFYGLDYMRLIFGVISVLIVFISIIAGLAFLLKLNRPEFAFVVAAIIVIFYIGFYLKFNKKLWEIRFDGEIMRVYFNHQLKSKFQLNELKKCSLSDCSTAEIRAYIGGFA